MNAPGFTHAETALVERLGLPQKRVRELRTDSLERGTDWLNTGGHIRYSDSGRARLLELLQIEAEPKKIVEPDPAAPLSPAEAMDVIISAVAGDPFAPAKPGEERELLLTKKYINRAIVQAKLGTVFVRVRVKDSRTLKLGTFVRCQLIEADLWKMTQRLPRTFAPR